MGANQETGRRSLRARAVIAVSIAAVYFGAAKLGLSMASVAEQVSAVWPPTGIALAALLIFGIGAWPGIAIGAFLANATTPHEPLLTAIGIALGNTLEAVAGAWLLQSVVGFRNSLGRLKDAVALILVGAVLSTTVSATLGVISLCLNDVHPWSAFGSLWRVWWLGDAMGDIVIAPALLTCAALRRVRWQPRRLAEGAVLTFTLVAVGLVVFGWQRAPGEIPRELEYLIFPCITWAALRFEPLAAALATLVASSIAIWGTLHGFGPFTGGSPGENLVPLVIFMAVVAVTGLLLASGIAERNATERLRAVGNAVTKVLAESPSLSDATPRILQAICDGLDWWDMGALWLVDSQSGVLRCAAVWHEPSVDVRRFEEATRRFTFTRGIGMPGRVWASGEPAWIPDVGTDPNFPRAPVAITDGLHTAFGFPILLGTQVLGVIEFFSREIRDPEPELLAFMAGLGSQLGLVVDRKRTDDEKELLLAREQEARAQAELLVHEAREGDRRKDEFLAMLGHELRNPLAPLRNAVHLLGAPGASAASVDRVRAIMERQIETLTRLVDDLLDVSRITRGKIELCKAPVDLATIVDVAVDTVRPLIEAQRHQLAIALPPEPVWLEVDSMRLEQVLANLLNNAIKYTEPGGRIWLTASIERAAVDARRVVDSTDREDAGSAQGHTIVIRVRDTGVGIPPDLLPHIFDLFTQANHSLDRSKGGLGIGLTLVRSLVELHGGTVSAHSQGTGRGSEFVVRLPCRAAAGTNVGSPANETTAAAGDSGSRCRVLVVDDNVDVAQTLAILLGTWGHEVVTVNDGSAALEVAETFHPDAVVLDIGLPGIDGYEVARRIRTHPKLHGALVIAMTGYGQAEDRRRSVEAEIDHHLVKPVDPIELRRLLETAESHAH
ncbi:MAG: MASE1 domain-containing protein [Planctomycetes bacterium]|nr:MASE1 domain-containing protein [Planctomycetota bacterium]MBI3845548.1 MASE1 domain-containing protein [Planctomycetota bacterium]